MAGGIEKRVNIGKIEEQRSDFEYWQSCSPLERLTALEEIRSEYNRWKYGAVPRLQRVYSIIKQQ